MKQHGAGDGWLSGRGAAAEQIRRHPWSATTLGALANWPASLRTAVVAVLALPCPSVLFWGEDALVLHNDAAAPLLGAAPLGRPAATLPIWPAVAARVRHLSDGLPDQAPASDDWHLSPVFDDGAAAGVGGVVAVLADTARAAAEERLRLGLEAARTVAWEIDLRTGKLHRSPNTEALFGWGTEPNDFAVRILPEDIASMHARFAEALLRPDGLYQNEFSYGHPDGRALQLRNWGKIVRAADGTALRVHGVCVDVTEPDPAAPPVRIEGEPSRALRPEDALRQLQKMQTLGQLTGGVAHDFNNLLGAIVGSFDLIRRKPGDPARIRQLAEAGLKIAERGSRLTGQLLTFSRAQPIALGPVGLGALLSGMRDMLERTLGPVVKLRISIGPDGVAALSDATQLELAVLNLAINARDAMPDGGTLTIATERVRLGGDFDLPDGDYAELRVSDDGLGMAPDVAAQAFEPFFTTKGVGRGTGLGLSQVYGMAQQARGTVRIDTAQGRGTTVRVLLPCTDLPVEAPAAPSPLAATPSAASLDVLLVDDDVDLREVMTASLVELGYVVREAGDGAGALDLLRQRAPDLMIADFAMPGMNGAELAQAARRLYPGLPVVIASGYADAGRLAAASGPATRTLSKPFRIAELQGAIDDVLAPKGA